MLLKWKRIDGTKEELSKMARKQLTEKGIQSEMD
jgi:hypothetical protein